MANKAWIVGTEKLMAWFYDNVNEEHPYWSLWQGKNLLQAYTDDDEEKGSNKLQSNIEVAEDGKVDDVFMLRLHESVPNRVINNKSPYYASITFRPCELPMGQHVGYTPYAPSQIAGTISKEYTALLDRLEGIEARLQEQQQPVQSEQKHWLAGLLENPQLVNGLIQRAMPIVDTLISKITGVNVTPLPAAVGEIEDVIITPQLKQALQVLNKHTNGAVDVHLWKLAAIAEKDPAMFQQLLLMMQNI